MAWTTGTTTNFANQSGGILGLLGKLLDWCSSAGYTETIGTGNGSQTVFGFTLTNTTIARGQCRVRYKIAGVDYEVFENGEGAFVGEKITTGTLDRATGIGSITFAQAIDNGYAIKALYTNATEDRDWLTYHQTTTKTNTGSEAFPGLLLQECILRNAGISYKDNVIVGMREWQQPSNQRWGWNLNLYPRYLVSDEGNWNCSSYWHGRTNYVTATQNYGYHPNCYFKENETIKYWFIANKRRIIVIARTASTLYMSAYLGFCKRVSTAIEYTMPGIVIGNYYGDNNFSYVNLVDCTHFDASTYISMSSTPDGIFVAPYDLLTGWSFAETTRVVKKTTNSKVNLFPLFAKRAIVAHPNRQVLYELDGIYKCPNEGLVAEDTITIGGDTYLVIPNIYRTNYYDYFCVKLE